MYRIDKIASLLNENVQNNILPITSRCQARCIFCSHRSNPEKLDIYYTGDIPFEILKQLIEFLDEDYPIIIGESSTRLCEGEPFLHKDFLKIIKSLRERFPKTKIVITTNGLLLDKAYIEFLKQIENIVLRISLNSLKHHHELVKKDFKRPFLDIIKLLKDANIETIVSLIYIKEYEDNIINEIKELIKEGIKEIRILKPGFSKFLGMTFDWPEDDFYKKIDILRENSLIFIEPPELKGLESSVIGIIKHSPAYACGLRVGDIIIKIGDYIPLSRVDTFDHLMKSGNTNILIKRGNSYIELSINKKKNEKSGIALDYDISKEDYTKIKDILEHNGNIATGKLSGSFFKKIFPEYEGNIISCKNFTFDGNIMASGLLTLSDISKCTSKEKDYYIPEIMMDNNGFDLLGENISDYPNLLIL